MSTNSQGPPPWAGRQAELEPMVGTEKEGAGKKESREVQFQRDGPQLDRIMLG